MQQGILYRCYAQRNITCVIIQGVCSLNWPLVWLCTTCNPPIFFGFNHRLTVIIGGLEITNNFRWERRNTPNSAEVLHFHRPYIDVYVISERRGPVGRSKHWLIYYLGSCIDTFDFLAQTQVQLELGYLIDDTSILVIIMAQSVKEGVKPD